MLLKLVEVMLSPHPNDESSYDHSPQMAAVAIAFVIGLASVKSAGGEYMMKAAEARASRCGWLMR